MMSLSDPLAKRTPTTLAGVDDLFGAVPEGGRRIVTDLVRRPLKEPAQSLRFADARDCNGEQGDYLAEASTTSHRTQMEQELKASLTAAREEGLRQAREQFASDLAAGLVEERRKVERVRTDFANDRQRFFAAAESQVVKLALAIAAKILSREVAGDELHLRATVNAALARLQESSATTLRVPVGEVETWTAFFETNTSGKVRVQGDKRMCAGECTLDTTVGRVELGVDVQLREVERSFDEMLQTNVSDVPDVPPLRGSTMLSETIIATKGNR